MAVNFPSNPTNGQTITVSGITYAYDSTQGVWSDNPQGLTQAIDALTDVDTSTSAPTNGQILQWNSTDSEWQPADSSAGVTVYATIDDLPLTGVTEGSMALVDSTDKLYIFSDAGWYSITLVNTTPSISGVNATYTLATDGTATVVTVTATDPEGIPLTYSIVSDTSGSVATVTQGTGANTNQWTITPSTNSANAGNFTLVFRASDGVNVASASSTFSLVFSIPNSNYTTALITSVGANNAVNNSFSDASTNNHTITANGNVTQNTFSPYRHGGNAVSFAGTNSSSQNYLWINAAIVPATGSWTYESWVRVDRKSDGERHSLISWYTNGASGRGNIFVRADNETNAGIVFVYVDGMSAYPQSTTRIDDSAWHHVVVERDGNVWSVWIDGTREDQETQNVTLNTSVNTRLGHIINTSATSHSGLKGLMRDVRFSTSARYQGAATITVPTEDQTTTTGYALLCCQSFDPFTDKTGTREITVYSSTSVKQEGGGPYDHSGYSTSANGGSMYFDGSGDYLSITHDSSLKPSTSGAFSVELWYYPTAHPSGNPAQITGDLGVTSYPSNCHGFDITHSTSGDLSVRWGAPSYQDGSSGDGGAITNNTLILNTWNHIVFCRNSESTATMALFLNGKRCWYESGSQISIADATASNFYVGYAGSASGTTFLPVTGAISNFKFRKGATSYDPTSATYTVPITAPAVSDTETSLLLNGTDAGIIDKSQSVKEITLSGGAKSSTTHYKYLTSSMYFDGSDDYLQAHSLSGNFLTASAWTQEMWIRLASTSAGQQIGPAFGGGASNWSSSNGHHWIVYTHGSGFLAQYYGTNGGATTITIASSAPFTANTWHHWAISWDGTTLRFFLDGTSVHTTTSFTPSSVSTSYLELGRMNDGSYYSEGYLSDVRITKGLARYTSNFTPPSAALEG